MGTIAIFILALFLYSLASKRMEQSIFTAPMIFTLVGILGTFILPDPLEHGKNSAAILRLAEVGLVFLLFTDASRTNLSTLRTIRALPARLLSIGMLLTIAMGAFGAMVVFNNLSIWEAGILASILAPTDAGLGQIIVSSSQVPTRIRQALNVEAGLNDGLSVPFLMFFIALAAVSDTAGEASLTRYLVEQLGYGVLIGTGIGFIGGHLIGLARKHGGISNSYLQIGTVTLPLLCLAVSELAGASMFIAAFVAGLTVQLGFKQAGKHSVEFTEDWGQFINLSVFFLFGTLVSQSWSALTGSTFLYAILSLTVIRMIPVAISLIGTKLSAASVLFMGWFGPRGLASIVLGLVYLEQEKYLPGEETIRLAIIATVLLSIFAHGVTAIPGINLYRKILEKMNRDSPELQELPR